MTMKKKYLLVLATAAILALSGCSNASNRLSADDGQPQEGDEPAEVVNEAVAPTSVRLNKGSYVLKSKGTEQVSLTIEPLAAYNAQFTFESSDTDVATISERGLITAVAEGKCVVTVKSNADTNVIDSAIVYVVSSLKSSDGRIAISSMASKQQENYYDSTKRAFSYPNTILSSMAYKNSITVDGKVKESFNLFRGILTDESNAYFSMATKANYTNTFDGGTHYQNYQYQMLANPGRYDSFIFYTSDSRKNVYYANTGFMADEIDEQGNKLPLNEVVLRLLDSLFSTGRELATDNQERSLESKYLNINKLSSVAAVGGKNGSVLSATYSVYDGSEQFMLATDQESSYGFPAGTVFSIALSYDFIWEEGACTRYVVNQVIEYDLDDKHYVENYDITYTMTFDNEVEYELPNVKDYNLVTDLYDL